jgi:hypothetical protein
MVKPPAISGSAPRTQAMRRAPARQARVGFIILAVLVALVHLTGVTNTPGRVSTLARSARRGEDALRSVRPGTRRQLLSSHCAAGKKWDAAAAGGDGLCVDCAAGKYQPLTGQSSCTDCPAGNFSSSTGSTSCDACAAGKYQPLTGQSSCTDCPAGNFSSSTGSTSCDAVRGGQVPASDGSVELYGLPAGNYSASTGSCDACAAGTYQPLTLGRTSAVELYELPGRDTSPRWRAGTGATDASWASTPRRGSRSAPDAPPGSRVLRTARCTWSCWW